MIDLVYIALGVIFAAGCFLGAIWIVEHASWGFWRWAIRNSEHCRLSGCVCTCHDARDDADRAIESAAARLGLRR